MGKSKIVVDVREYPEPLERHGFQVPRWLRSRRLLTSKICSIPNQPNRQESQRKPIRTPQSIIRNKLGDLFQSSAHPLLYNIFSEPAVLTSKKIHVARLMLPKTPDKASCGVRSRDKGSKSAKATEIMSYEIRRR
jgi:hypothetical protein